MNWKYIKPIADEKSVSEFEKEHGVLFPESFKAVVKKYNGARPENDVYDTEKTKERTIKSLLSFNKTDKENIWAMAENSEIGNSDKYVAFAIDHFGNLICFDVEDYSVVFVSHESDRTEKIADDFSGFLDKLYSV